MLFFSEHLFFFFFFQIFPVVVLILFQELKNLDYSFKKPHFGKALGAFKIKVFIKCIFTEKEEFFRDKGFFLLIFKKTKKMINFFLNFLNKLSKGGGKYRVFHRETLYLMGIIMDFGNTGIILFHQK